MERLRDTMAIIKERYPFTPEHYPALSGMSKESAFAFAVRHVSLHLGKALGKLAAFSEAMDHGGHGDAAALEEATVKMYINALRLAELQGMTEEQISAAVPKFLKDQRTS